MYDYYSTSSEGYGMHRPSPYGLNGGGNNLSAMSTVLHAKLCQQAWKPILRRGQSGACSDIAFPAIIIWQYTNERIVILLQ
jgi:hypothetical protein